MESEGIYGESTGYYELDLGADGWEYTDLSPDIANRLKHYNGFTYSWDGRPCLEDYQDIANHVRYFILIRILNIRNLMDL